MIPIFFPLICRYKAVSRKRPTTTQISIVEQEDGNHRYSTTVESVNNHFTHTPETTTRYYGSLNRRTTTIQTEQYSTPQTSSSYPYPSTTTSNNANDPTNTQESQFTTNSPTHLNDLGFELTSTLTSIDRSSNPSIDNSYITTDASLNDSPILTTESPDLDKNNNNNHQKTDTLTQTNPIHSVNSKISFSFENIDKTSGSKTNQAKTEHDEHLLGSKLTTTHLPTENPSSPTVTPSSFVVDHRENEFVTTQSNHIESSSILYKPTYGGGISSPRPFSFSKRTRPTTTTTSTTEFTPSEKSTETNVASQSDKKVSVASNHNTNEIGHLDNENAPSLEGLSQIQVSGNSNAKHALNVTVYSIANATNDDDDEHSTVNVNNDTNSILTSDSLSNNSEPSTTITPPVHSSTASSVNSRTRSRTKTRNSRVNSSQTTEQSNIDVTQHRFSQRRIRTRPTAKQLNVDTQEPSNPILDDDVHHVTYDIERHNTQSQGKTAVVENNENENAPKVDRTNVIRRRGFRPKLNDLLKENSSGQPAASELNQGKDRPELNSDISSLTSIDLSRKHLSQNGSRSRNTRRRPTKPADTIPEEGQADTEFENKSSTSAPSNRNTERRIGNRYTSRPRVSSVEDSVMEQSHNIELAHMEIDRADIESQTIVVPLARKINIDTSFQNHLNSFDRKVFGRKPFVQGGDSPIIYLNQNLASTNPPQTTFANVPDTTESLQSLGGDSQGTFTPFVLETFENTSEGENYGNEHLFNQKVHEIRGIIDSFKSTEIPIVTESSSVQSGADYLARLANAINALDTEVDGFKLTGNDITTTNPEKELNKENTEYSSSEQPSTERNAVNQRRRRPSVRRTTTTEASVSVENTSSEANERRLQSRRRFPSSTSTEANASVENGSTEFNGRRVQFQSRRRSTTTESNIDSNEEFSSSTPRSRQQAYRGRVKAPQDTVDRFSNKVTTENLPVELSTENIDAQSSTENALIQSFTESITVSSDDLVTDSGKEGTTAVSTELNNTEATQNNEQSSTEVNLPSSTELNRPSSTESSNKRRKVLRRRPANRQQVNGTSNENVQSSQNVNNENDQRERTVFRGRVRAQTAENVETANENSTVNSESKEQTTVDSTARRYKPRGRFSTTTQANVDSDLENVNNADETVSQNEQNTDSLATRQRQFPRRRFSTTTEAADLNENVESQSENTENDSRTNDRLNAQRRRRPNFQRTRTSTESAEQVNQNDESSNNDNESENSRVPAYRRRQFGPRARTSTESAPELNGNENVDENVNVENENVGENARIPSYRRRQFGPKARTSTETAPELNDNENVEKNVNVENEKENENARIPSYRRRPFGPRARTSTESTPELNDSENVDENVNVGNENESPRVRLPGVRRRPFALRTSTTTEASDEYNENESIDGNVDNEKPNVRIREPPYPRRPYAPRGRTSTESTNEQIEENDNNSEVQTNEDPSESPSPRDPVNDALRNRLRQRYRNRLSTTEGPEGQEEINQGEQEQSEENNGETIPKSRPTYVRKKINTFKPINNEENESSDARSAIADRIKANKANRNIFANRRTTTTTSAPESDVTENELNNELSGNEATEVNEQTTENNDIQNELEDIESGTLSDAIATTETYNESDNAASTQRSVDEHSSESNGSVKSSTESNNTTKSSNRKRIIKKIRKTTSTTPSSIEEGSEVEQSSEGSTPENKPTGRGFRPASLRFRESRKQFIKSKGDVTNKLDADSVEQTDQDNENVDKPRPIYSNKQVRNRISVRPARPSFSLKTTAKSESADDQDESGEQQEGDDEQDSETPRKNYQRKYTKTFRLPQNPQDPSQFQPSIVESQDEILSTPKLKPFRPKGLRVNKYTSKKPTESSEATVDLDGPKVNALNVRNRNLFSKRIQNRLKSTVEPSSQNTNTDTADTTELITDSPIPVELANTENPSPINVEHQFDDMEIVNDIESNTNTQSALTDDDNVATTTFTSIDNAINEQFEQNTDGSSTDNPTEPNLNSINLVTDTLQEAAKPIRKLYTKSTTATPTTVKPTTYHHVFAIDYDESPFEKLAKQSQKPNEIGQDDPNAEVIHKKVEKLAEVNRIVEVYSQQRRQTIQRSSNAKPKSQTSNLIIERLPTVNKLGEINRVTLIKLVNQNDTRPTVKEFITFLTTTAAPAVDDYVDNSVKKVSEKKGRQILMPENIFSVETSTIPLEGLFQTDRNGKKLNVVYATTGDDSYLRTSPSPVFIPQTTTEQPSQTTISDGEYGDTTADAVNDIHVVNAEQPNTLHLNDSTPPLVISLANLDSVVLSHVTPANSTKTTKANAFDGAVASSGKVSTFVDAPHVVVEHSTVDNLDEQSPVVNTQTSYSSEITQTKVKRSQLKRSNAPSDFDIEPEVSDT